MTKKKNDIHYNKFKKYKKAEKNTSLITVLKSTKRTNNQKKKYVKYKQVQKDIMYKKRFLLKYNTSQKLKCHQE